jgi:hypothetical protein
MSLEKWIVRSPPPTSDVSVPTPTNVDISTKIRTHETEHLPAATDVIEALTGTKNGRVAWMRFKKTHPEILPHIKSEKVRQGFLDYLTKEAYAILIANLGSNSRNGGDKNLAQLRLASSQIAVRFWSADPTLATEVIDRVEDPEQLEYIAQRAQSKLTQRALTDAIKGAGGSGQIYAIVNNKNDVAVTGLSAKQIVTSRAIGKKRVHTRDLLSRDELIELQFLELTEQRAFKKLNPDAGNKAVEEAQKNVLTHFNAMKSKF